MDNDSSASTPSGPSKPSSSNTPQGRADSVSAATPQASSSTRAVAGPSSGSSTAHSSQNSKRRRGLGIVTPNACTECRKKRAKVRATRQIVDDAFLPNSYCPGLIFSTLYTPNFSISRIHRKQILILDSATAAGLAVAAKAKTLNASTKFPFANPKRTSAPKSSSSAIANDPAIKFFPPSFDPISGRMFSPACATASLSTVYPTGLAATSPPRSAQLAARVRPCSRSTRLGMPVWAATRLTLP